MSRLMTDNGTALGYAQVQGPEGKPIIFLHGVGSDKSVWAPQLAHFDTRRRAIAFDYPGYGESDAARETTSRDDYASAILSGMDELGIDQAHICGLSLGGIVAIAMHEAAPLRCLSLILADSFAVHPDGSLIYERSVAGSSDLRSFAEARVDMLLAQPASLQVRREVVETMARISPEAYKVGARAVWLADQRERAGRIDVPALVLVGSEDQVTPEALSSELVAMLRHARLEVIPNAGHLSNLEQAAAFNTSLDAFMREVEAA